MDILYVLVFYGFILRLEIIQQIVNKFKKFEQVEGITLAGSIAFETEDENSDINIDILEQVLLLILLVVWNSMATSLMMLIETLIFLYITLT